MAPRPSRPPRAAAKEQDRVVLHCDLPSEALGIEGPPGPLHLTLTRRRRGWTLAMDGDGERRDGALRWLDGLHPASIHEPAGPGERVIRAEFRELPARWRKALLDAPIVEIRIDASRNASVRLEGTRTQAQTFLQVAQQGGAKPRLRSLGPVERQTGVTPRQLEALRIAVDEGYYRIPRQTTLEGLASMMQLSASTVSELLRRAEAQVVPLYLSLWDRGEEGR